MSDFMFENLIKLTNPFIRNSFSQMTWFHLFIISRKKSTFLILFFLGHVFANLPHNEKFASEAMAKDEEEEDELLINVIEEGNAMLQNLQILNMQPQICLRDRDSAYKPINLYHKVGHGKLDMYVINPSKDAKEIREFMERWNGENSKSLGNVLLYL